MPQRMLQELRGRKQEKVAPFLTLENLTGVLVFFAPAYIGTSGAPLLIRAPLVIGAAALGYILTMEHRGMALYERLILRAGERGSSAAHRSRPGADCDQRVAVRYPYLVLRYDLSANGRRLESG